MIRKTFVPLLLVLCLAVLWPGQASARTVIKLGIVMPPGSGQHVTAEKFGQLLEERSGGEYAVDIFHSGSLGTETAILQQVQMGAVEMAIITLGPFDTFVPEVKVVSFPFMFRDYEQVDEVLDGPLGQEVLASLERAGFKGIAFSENGFRNLTNNVRPVHSVDDAKGLKIRVMESTLHKELWRTLGANPTPMGWPIYSELQQGTIDGQENPLWVVWTSRLFEVQKYLSLTGHVYSAHVDIANLGWFNSLPEETRTLIATCMRDAARYQRAWNRTNVADFLAKLKDAGMIVDENPDLASFKARAASLRNMDIYSDPATRELLDKFLDATSR
ncbi:tripartite ATP-independent transporter DctP family solute receptor [Desulfobaculum xiamenense]|uniref:Tripartite ATP-independent transporter DctP family solute receptor n=1 Tax=Desulfobaculum xiamenense TaxID=995050 RepID=A0A846QKI4_9BACT|nr:TRAP transporter substrate-binding protein [Desulfobaculum xiamenense]NJB67657.1 tripartite ATP-independent transporter DctP family solute receptor [Desulfobaculum xiamenense]